MAQVKFGGLHTIRKLDCLESYLKAYLKVFKNRPWAHTIYVDAFAGTGTVPQAAKYPELQLDDAGRDFIVGSVQRALSLNDRFSEYVFIEKKRSNARELTLLKNSFPDRQDRIHILNEDANAGLKRLCATRNWKQGSRAVVFLDPFGSQVEWRTIELLAATEAVDLWYLFPAGLSVYRQVRSKDGSVHEGHQGSLDRILGTPDWRKAFAEEIAREPDLFGTTERGTRKAATTDSATLFFIQRMKQIFHGGVLDEYLSLGSGNVHMFSLVFAWANPSPKAAKAGDIAKSVMRSGQRGRSVRD